MSRTFLRLELRRFIRDRVSVFFIALLPAFFFLIFGTQDFANEDIGNGNVVLLHRDLDGGVRRGDRDHRRRRQGGGRADARAGVASSA